MPSPDPHPIDPAVRTEIMVQLAMIEQQHDVKILFACESGSRGWGFASPDSDYDVRFIYVPRLTWYLKVSPQRDVIELPISDVLDISGWELRKALGLLKKGNATLIEWLDSPVIYHADPLFLPAIQAAATAVHSPDRTFYHYIHMARKNYRECLTGESIRLKKYLYVLRPILASCWIERGLGTVPMRFQTLVDTLLSDHPSLQQDIHTLLDRKRRAAEAEYGTPIPAISRFIEHELTRLEQIPPNNLLSTSAQQPDPALLDTLLFDTILAHNVRTASVIRKP